VDLGVRPRVGPMAPEFELGRDFCTVHPIAKFHRRTFNGSEVIVLTNKQTPLKTSTSLRRATPVGNDSDESNIHNNSARATVISTVVVDVWFVSDENVRRKEQRQSLMHGRGSAT